MDHWVQGSPLPVRAPLWERTGRVGDFFWVGGELHVPALGDTIIDDAMRCCCARTRCARLREIFLAGASRCC